MVRGLRLSCPDAGEGPIDARLVPGRPIRVLLAKVLLVGGYFALGSQGPIFLRPDSKLDEDRITVAMLCGEGRTPQGRGSKVLEEMSPDRDVGAWSRGRTVRGDCDVWYQHTVSYNPHRSNGYP